MTDDIIKFRHLLHKYPGVSNNEFETTAAICRFAAKYSPDEVIRLSETGVAFVYNGKQPGETLMFRAELDGLPISEKTNLEYASIYPNVSHACGHDGHIAIMAGLIKKISENRPEKGRVVLLFQPAEETEQGAKDVLSDPAFNSIEPDYIFALHNIPGVETHKVLLKNGNFAAASKGMTVKLFGKTSHAAEPENGINPANATALIIFNLQQLAINSQLFKDMALLTIIHIRLGEIAFGTSPGYAEIRITLRAFDNDDMDILTKESENIITEISKAEKLKHEISYSEIFPATVNNKECVSMAEKSAKENNLKTDYIDKPFKWSEDFAYYTQKYKACFFGIGAGITHSQLHNPDYDFPDEIIDTGTNLFFNIYKKINL